MVRMWAGAVAAAVLVCAGCGGGGEGDDDAASGPDAAPELVDPWAASAGASGDDLGVAVAVGPSGDIYVVGQFGGDIVLGAGQDTEVLLSAAGGLDMFVARYSPSGTLRWARRAGGTSDDTPTALGVGDDETVYVATAMSASAVYGGPDGMTELPSSGTDTAALVRIDPDGSLVWARRIAELGVWALDLEVDADGTVVLGGFFRGTVVFGAGEPNEVEFTAMNEKLFVARYRDDGTLVFAFDAGVAGGNRVAELEIDGAGEITAAGVFFGDITFGMGTAQESTLSSSSIYGEGVFVARFGPDGALRWAAGASGGSIDAYGLSVGTDGSVTITGRFGVVARFDEGGPRATALDSNSGFSGRDMFVARYGATGTFEWAQQGVGTAFSGGREVVGLDDDAVLVIGGLEGYTMFDEYSLSADVLDAIAVTYDRNGAVVSAETIVTGPGVEWVLDATLAPDGDLVATGYFTETASLLVGGSAAPFVSAGGADLFVARFDR